MKDDESDAIAEEIDRQDAHHEYHHANDLAVQGLIAAAKTVVRVCPNEGVFASLRAALKNLEEEVFTVKCPECERVFDLSFEVDASEWYYGHDCEGSDHRGTAVPWRPVCERYGSPRIGP